MKASSLIVSNIHWLLLLCLLCKFCDGNSATFNTETLNFVHCIPMFQGLWGGGWSFPVSAHVQVLHSKRNLFLSTFIYYRAYVCMCVCTHLHVHVCVYVHVCICVCTCVCMCVHPLACAYMCVHTCVCMYVHVCTCICICVCMCVHVHSWIGYFTGAISAHETGTWSLSFFSWVPHSAGSGIIKDLINASW